MKRGIITIIALIVVGALIAWVLTNNKKENEAKIAVVADQSGAVIVKTAIAKKDTLNLNFSANGNFTAKHDLNLLAETGGRVTQILVDEGSRVSKGQILVRIDTEYASLDLQNAEASYLKLKKDQERYASSYETGGVTKSQLDDIELALRNAETMVQQARRRVQDSYIKSPISGIVNERLIEPGAFVAPGTPLFNIVDVSSLKLKVNANEQQVVNLKTGDQVKITSTVFPDKTFHGVINFIAPKADNTLNYPVEIEVTNKDANNLRAGMYATATFEFPKQDPALMIPRTSFAGGVNSNQIFILENDNTARIRDVVSGRIIGEQVEIIGGLTEGEIIITSGQINLIDGTQVKAQ
jgi:RND family efflux transporter MFP subunit